MIEPLRSRAIQFCTFVNAMLGEDAAMEILGSIGLRGEAESSNESPLARPVLRVAVLRANVLYGMQAASEFPASAFTLDGL